LNILDKIIADKKIEVKEQKTLISIDQLKNQIKPLPKCRNFYKAVTKPNKRGLNVIAELKKASPSAGIIREDFNPVDIAKIYKNCNADAISILTDEKYFQGKIQYIKQVRDVVDMPILRKDFIIDPWQIYQSRAAGADAVLLIAETLNTSQLSDLMILASELTLTVLLEIHSMESLLSVRSMIGFPKKGYSILGINNRNLETMKVDLNNTIRLAEFVDNKRELVAESGIKTKEHVEKLISVGLGAVLIGQTLCEHTDIEQKFNELFS